MIVAGDAWPDQLNIVVFCVYNVVSFGYTSMINVLCGNQLKIQ